ncbi:MAG TPA: PRC-barrel domain-containing protein [Sphingobium sp.]|nr:PRC-barrel domain-containing protein [Sphingobium sp.]
MSEHDTIATDETSRLIASDKVEGTRVYNTAGERLGHIQNFMVDKRSGKAEYAVMEFGGFLGIGTAYYPLPWEKLTYSTAQGGYVVDIDKARLEGAPHYRDEAPAFDEAYGRKVYGYWDVPAPFI